MAKPSQWARRIARLRSMPAKEIADRVRQQVTARMDAWRYQRGDDFAGELPSSTAEAPPRFFFAPSAVPTLCGLLLQRFPASARAIVAQAENIVQHRFDLLGFESLDYGPEIDWHLDVVHGKRAPRRPWFRVNYLDFDEVGDSKITWELNRHQHLVTLAKAYRLTGDDRFARELVRSLAVSGRHMETFLSTYFSPNTHLLGEAAALFFLGTLFPELPRAARWQQRGWKLILESAARQVRTDGFYFEQSTYYHVYALDMFLHTRVLAVVNDVPVPVDFDRTLEKMLDALCLLGRGGVPARPGDDDGGRWFDGRRNRTEHLLDPLGTGAVLFGRGDFKFFAGSMREETLWLLGARGLADFEMLNRSDPSSESVSLGPSGFYLMAEAETGQQLVLGAGPQGPGHGHADALSLELIRNGRALLIDPGTYQYVGDDGKRGWYRGTSAHNTMRVDGLDQAERIDPFGWAKPPMVKLERWITASQFNLFAGSQDGYARLAEPVMHHRWVFHRKGQFWLVRDLAQGYGKHQIELAWHLGATLSPVSTKDNLFADGQDSLCLVTPEGHGWSQSAHRGNWSPVYGWQERATVLTFGFEGALPAEFATLLLPDASLADGMGRLQRVASDASVCAYRYVRAGQEHHFFFPNGDRTWTHGNWASDARFLYWTWDRERGLRLLVMCGGSYVETGGVRVLTSERILDYAEVVSLASGTEVFSSDPDQVVLEGSLDRVELELAAPANDPGTSV